MKKEKKLNLGPNPELLVRRYNVDFTLRKECFDNQHLRGGEGGG